MRPGPEQFSGDSIDFEVVPPEEYEKIGKAYRQRIIASNNIDGVSKDEQAPGEGEPISKSEESVIVQAPDFLSRPPESPGVDSLENHLSPEEVRQKYFGYQDADLPEERKAVMREFSNTNESSKKYAQALSKMIEQYGLEAIKEKSDGVRAECQRVLSSLGITPSKYMHSQTWSMWDLAKQYYFTLHPDENDNRYSIGDPMESPEKLEEIALRHVGWEFYGFPRRLDVLKKITDLDIRIKLLEYLGKEPKANHSLSSKDLAEIGGLLKLSGGGE